MKPKDRKKPHRATSEIPIILDQKFYVDLEQTILKVQWPYKSEHKDTFVMRDRALVFFLIATGLRISEALAVKTDQFRDHQKKLVLFNVQTLKNGRVRKETWITKVGSMKRITKFFINWYTLLAFPLKRRSHEVRRCNSTLKLHIIPSFANLTRLDLSLFHQNAV